jgi:hypothetical protein
VSKTVGTILLVAAVVVAIAVPVIGPAQLALLGISETAIAAVSAGLSAAMMVNSLLMAKGDLGATRSRQASATTLQLGEVPRTALFGAAAIGS